MSGTMTRVVTSGASLLLRTSGNSRSFDEEV
jgi:hypothetical protein